VAPAHSLGHVTRVVGAVLAAGSGSRMGTPKGELSLDGVRLVDRAAGVLADAGCTDVVAVTRSRMHVPGARVIVNDDPDRGMRSSLGLAVAAASERGTDALAVILVDTPGITADAVRTVIAAWNPGRIAVAAYGGRRGHPIVMAPDMWRRALELAGPDEGARALLRAERDRVDDIPAVGNPADLDTREDLARWTATRNRAP
jgi:CTP:molybdopterin cytidylyltransferase MocA